MPKLTAAESLAKKYDPANKWRSDARTAFLLKVDKTYRAAVLKAGIIKDATIMTLTDTYNKSLSIPGFITPEKKVGFKQLFDMEVAAVKKDYDKSLSAAASASRKDRAKEIIIPAWDDIIHIARDPVYTKEQIKYMEAIVNRVDNLGVDITSTAGTYGLSVAETTELLDLGRAEAIRAQTAQEKIFDMFKSPTPALSKNLGVVMTAIDDVQDFTTTVGVFSRALGRVVPVFNELAVGAFTVSEAMNRFNVINRLSGGEISQLCRLLREARNSSHLGTVKADVDKRMKRIMPSKGELLEVAQTTDTLFGLGVSLGPLVGLATDLIFGSAIGAPIRFKDWEMSPSEIQAVTTIGGLLDISDAGFGFALGEDFDRVDTTGYKVLFTGVPPPKYSAAEILSQETPTQADLRLALVEGLSLNESAAILVANGKDLPGDDYLRSLIALIDSNLTVRKEEVKKALKSLWEAIWPYAAKPKKKTKTETRLLMQSLGIDPYGPSDWPIEGLGSAALPGLIQERFEIAANESLAFWRKKFGKSSEGLFLDACVKEIGTHAAVMFAVDDGVITESLTPELLIYINALESHLNPPPDTSDEKFSEWVGYIKQEMDYYFQSVPDIKLLQAAYSRFF